MSPSSLILRPDRGPPSNPWCETHRKSPLEPAFFQPGLKLGRGGLGWYPACWELGEFLSAFVLTWRHLEASRVLAPNRIPLFLWELLT